MPIWDGSMKKLAPRNMKSEAKEEQIRRVVHWEKYNNKIGQFR
jgi:hypothetical protein